MLSNFIDLKVFLVALAVGILYVYVSDDYKVIILYLLHTIKISISIVTSKPVLNMN